MQLMELYLMVLTTGGIPVEGSGSRMMWYQGKSAFRAGKLVPKSMG